MCLPAVERQAARLQTGHVEEVVHQQAQLARLPLDLAQRPLRARRVEGPPFPGTPSRSCAKARRLVSGVAALSRRRKQR
jgi:hypothetical protein